MKSGRTPKSIATPNELYILKEEIKLKRIAIIEELVEVKLTSTFNLSKEYTHIRGYHGCRPLDVETYYLNGIKPLTKNDMLLETLHRLKGTYIDDKKIRNAFEKRWQSELSSEEGIWFTVSTEELLNSGHYMIYGSEFIQAVAADLLSHDLLKNHGIPTIFSIDIPLSNISVDWLQCLESNIIQKNTSGGYHTNSPILATNVISHIHPNKIIDWHNGGEIYFNKI